MKTTKDEGREANRFKSSRPYKLLAYNFRGFPIGIVVGFILAASVSFFAAPMILDSKKVSFNHSHIQIQNKLSAGIKASPQPNSNQSTSTSGQSPSHTATPTSTSTPINSNKTPTSSSPVTNTASNTPEIRPQAIITGIEVLSPTQGANETVYFPYCDFGSIDSGIPETCYHYQPIPFNLVDTLSDGTTSPLAWSSATVTALNPSGGYPPYPTLVNIDKSNNTLIEGTGMGYFLNTNTTNEIVTMDVNYGQWSYTKYIHIYVNSLWGNP
jgi:hypothetical protein